MGKLLGVEKEAHRKLYTDIFIEMAQGATVIEMSAKYGKSKTIINNTLHRILLSLVMNIREESDFPFRNQSLRPNMSLVRNDPEYWLKKFREKEKRLRFTSDDQYPTDFYVGKP